MKIGFARADITPRLGVELCGFGPYLNRHSIGVRDRLWARAMAIEQDGQTLVLVSCDLIGVMRETTRRVREMVRQTAGLGKDAVMVHCTHTHSGPATIRLYGWGVPDEPYLETLPQRIARACILALEDMREATLSYAESPCEGIGLNRERDRDAPPLEEALRDDWRPAKPELTDTTCHVFKAESGGRLLGFLSYFGCHPVVCCQETQHIHGDFAGVATNMLEREHPGSVGLFLQGAQGDVNSCVAHQPEQESLLALDVIAARYANSVRAGLARARPLTVESLACTRREVHFTRIPLPLEDLRHQLAGQEAILRRPDADEKDYEVRLAAVYAPALRGLVEKAAAGMPPDAAEMQGFRVGPAMFLGAPFEIFQAIKNQIAAGSGASPTLVMGLTNDCQGYAPDREAADRGGYTTRMVPMLLGAFPFADIHGELVERLLELSAELLSCA